MEEVGRGWLLVETQSTGAPAPRILALHPLGTAREAVRGQMSERDGGSVLGRRQEKEREST